MAIEFSDRQRTTIAAAITILSAVVILVAIGALFWIVGAFFVKFSAVFLPLAVAMVAALVVKPFYEGICTRLKLGRVPALIVVFLSVIVPIGALGWFFGDLLVDQVKGLVEAFPKMWAATVDWVRARAPQLVHIYTDTALGQAFGDAVEGQGSAVVDIAQYLGRRMVTAGAGVLLGVASLLGWVVAPIYFAFFLMADTSPIGNLERFIPFLRSGARKDLIYLFEEFLKASSSSPSCRGCSSPSASPSSASSTALLSGLRLDSSTSSRTWATSSVSERPCRWPFSRVTGASRGFFWF